MPRTWRILTSLLVAAGLSAAEPTFKVGLLCSGSTTDGGWNQLAKEGADSLKASIGAQVSIEQKVTADKAGDEMRAYAADGYDLVIAHGYEFLTAAAEAAAAGGTTRLAVSGADEARPGIVSIDFDLSQASYEVGILAARLSKTGKLAFIGGSKIPSVLACYRGFLAGAHSVRADASVRDVYTDWDQPEKSKAQAEALFHEGFDAVFHDVDAASRGIFEAVKEHNDVPGTQPVWVFGSCADQNANPICAQWTPASAVIRLDRTFLALAKSIQDKTFKPGVVKENLARGTCVLSLNQALLANHTIPASVKDELAIADQKLISGAITIPAPAP
jgi:basic membrane protein A